MHKPKIVISCGPIPAKLDPVKFLTNRFKGGLAFATASHFIELGYEVTIIKWTYTHVPEDLKTHPRIVDVYDVCEYYDWFKRNALKYDVFIMAAAVANLMPSNPYEGKFPSHNYKVGEKFNIEFEIAPRAIDVVKEINPKAFLVGYKLFDAKSVEELIDIGRHTLHDSRANVIFANTPNGARYKKVALLQDNSAISMSFDEHLDFIERLINQEYFKTEIIDMDSDEEYLKHEREIETAFNMVTHFENSISGFGCIACKIGDHSFVTTSRGHAGKPVFVKSIDEKTRTVYASEKATLNAPAMNEFLKGGFDIAIHRHEESVDGYPVKYLFPGTMEECLLIREVLPNCRSAGNTIIEQGHGYIKGINLSEMLGCHSEYPGFQLVKAITGYDRDTPESVDWNSYSQIFPRKYFNPVDKIEMLINIFRGKETLEVGGNRYSSTKYVYDPYVSEYSSIPITTADLSYKKFDLIVAKNSINYLSEETINLIKNALNPGGLFVANTFDGSPSIKVTNEEFVFSDTTFVYHYLVGIDAIYFHTFYNRNAASYEKMGFKTEKYRKNSLLITYQKPITEE